MSVFVDLPDARLFYETSGESGTPVLLIMGFGVPGHMWLNQIPTLATRHRVAWFDNVGAGGRTEGKRSKLPTMRDLGRHAVAVMDALGWDRAHVVGVSMGGMVAQELALGHTSRIRSLSLVVTHAGGLRNALPPARALALFLTGFLGPRARRARALERLIFPDDYLAGVDVAPLRRALSDHVVAAAPARDRMLQIAAVMTHRTARRLPALADTPTLVVKAAKDRLIRPRECHRLHTLIPNSRLLELPHAGHAVLHQCADELNDALLDHFARADRA
jgi:pimeloyl-ACP methyl ester carboxylesterase